MNATNCIKIYQRIKSGEKIVLSQRDNTRKIVFIKENNHIISVAEYQNNKIYSKTDEGFEVVRKLIITLIMNANFTLEMNNQDIDKYINTEVTVNFTSPTGFSGYVYGILIKTDEKYIIQSIDYEHNEIQFYLGNVKDIQTFFKNSFSFTSIYIK